MNRNTRLLTQLWTVSTTLLVLCAGASAQVKAPASRPDFARISGNLVTKSTGQVANPAAMNSPTLMILQQQKQAADLEAGQIMAAPGGGGPAASASGAGRTSVTLAARPATNASPSTKLGVKAAAPPAAICMAGVTGIRTVNQKKNGVVFTPDPRYDLYTITGCGFGSSPGRIYLQGTGGAFSAHGGKLTLTPVDPVRGWADAAIIAKLDPKITGELDQDNVTLVVETSSGQRAQAGGFNFYAVRGPAFVLKQIPKTAACTTFDPSPNALCPAGAIEGNGVFGSPCHPFWTETVLIDCTIKIYRDGPFVDMAGTGTGKQTIDKFTPKLKPGFAISAAMVQVSTLQEDQGHVFNPYMLKFTGNQVVITEQPTRKPAPMQDHYFVFYGVTLWAYGPAGITNPLADAQ